jgi:hypothetical protein
MLFSIQDCSKHFRWTWHAEGTVAVRSARKIGEPELKTSFLRPRLEWAIILKLK